MEHITSVRRFFEQWGRGSYADLRGAYEQFLADDCVYENTGLPTCTSKAAVLGMIDAIAAQAGIAAIRAEVLAIAVTGDTVLSERVDHHLGANGVDVMPIHLCGVIEMRDDKIARWRDYYDPAQLGAAAGR